MPTRRTVNDINFQSLAERCEEQYSKFKGTAQGFIRFFFKKHMHVDNVSTYAALSVPNALRRMILANSNLRDNPNLENIIVQTAKEFAEDVKGLHLAREETASRIVVPKRSAPHQDTHPEKPNFDAVMTTLSNFDSHAFMVFLAKREFGTSVSLSRTTVVNELLSKYQSVDMAVSVLETAFTLFTNTVQPDDLPSRGV